MKARKVLSRVEETLGRTFANVNFEAEESGYAVSCTLALQSVGWNDAVVELLELGHQIAAIWQITNGSECIRKQFSGEAKKPNLFKVAGIEAVDWWIGKDYDLNPT